MRLCRGFPNLLSGQVAEQKKTGGVGVPGHAFAGMFARKQVDGGVFKCVVTSCFENEWEVEKHGMIIS